MKLVNFRINNDIRVGLHTDNGIVDIQEVGKSNSLTVPRSMKELIETNNTSVLKKIEEVAAANNSAYLNPEEVAYAPIVMDPEKILCVGLNYQKHVDESQIADTPKEPVLFSKFNNALAAHQETIPLPDIGEQFDYEVELVVVIGKEAKNIKAANALDYVFGYSIANDLSIRDLQFLSGQWLIGKTTDKFAPVGPVIVTADEIDPHNLEISLKRNGKVVQFGHTKDMIFDVAQVISYASERMTLKPGDIILTGTPDGVIMGYPEKEQKWLEAGDVLEATIENIGTLVNTMG